MKHGFALLALVATLGCEYTPPESPFHYDAVAVSGTVTVGGEPLPGGWISFHPIGPIVGDHVIAAIDRQGRFSVKNCPVGPMQVRVDFNQATKLRLQEIAQSQPLTAQGLLRTLPHVTGLGSKLRFTTRAQGENRYELDFLTAEIGQ